MLEMVKLAVFFSPSVQSVLVGGVVLALLELAMYLKY